MSRHALKVLGRPWICKKEPGLIVSKSASKQGINPNVQQTRIFASKRCLKLMADVTVNIWILMASIVHKSVVVNPKFIDQMFSYLSRVGCIYLYMHIYKYVCMCIYIHMCVSSIGCLFWCLFSQEKGSCVFRPIIAQGYQRQVSITRFGP
jgi:hypothetical protein